MKKKTFKNLIYTSIFTILLLIIAEVIISTLEIIPTNYYINTPNSGFTWEINNNEIIGINQNSEVAFDALGARSISDYKKAEHKIVVFGGSTTACFALTQEKTWSALLEKNLGDNYWVGNFGRPGNSSNHHTLQFKHTLEKPELRDTKTVLIMQGVNDFVGYLVSKEQYLNSAKQKLKKIAFQHSPNDEIPFYKRLNLYKLASKAKKNITFYFKHKDHLTKTVVDIKELKKQSQIIDSLPSLAEGLSHYKKNTINLINQAKSKNINLVFVTQATMWKPNLEPELEALMLTSGFQNNEAFYSIEAFSIGMDKFNNKLIEVCKQENVPYIDLDLPKNTSSFYDDFHFNESGAKLTAKQIANALKQIIN